MYKYLEISQELEVFKNLILKWNKVHNLISKNSEEFIDDRHIADSLRIFQFIDTGVENICDFGSGAGFPAIPLAIYFNKKNIPTKIYIYESRKKKADFLSLCIKELELANAIIVNERIEKAPKVNADLITARAFSNLKNIFDYSSNFRTENTKFLLHKGEKINHEIEDAKKYYSFEHNMLDKNEVGGIILLASRVKAK